MLLHIPVIEIKSQPIINKLQLTKEVEY